LGWLGNGSPLAVLASVLFAAFTLILVLLYRRYIGILGADRRKPSERQAYDALRNSLAAGNLAARLYVRRLASSLEAVDRFLGDAGTVGQRAFGLKTPAPLWTIPAFHFCLLLALIYPIVIVVVVWAISGHVGPAEFALHLNAGLIAWKRWLAAVLIGLSALALWGAMRRTGWRRMAWSLACIGAFVAGIAIAVSDVFTTTASSTSQTIPCVYTVGPQGLVCTVEYTINVTHLVAVAVALLGTGIVAGVVVFIGAFLGIIGRLNRSGKHRSHGVFLSLLLLVMIAACLTAAHFLSSLGLWQIAGPLLLFLGLLTLLNAPFDWASLGLTRALMRRGLELGGWWPYALALIDACLAAVIIAALALTIVLGVQAFDALAVYGGGAPVLPLDSLFNGIETHPTTPEYWWVYALLLSTMIPSLVNLVIGGTSLARGLPGVPSLLLRFIPARGTVPKFDRAWIATVLTAQVAAGAALGIAAQVLLVAVIIGYVMPFFGLELLDMARDMAAFNVPARVGELLGVSL
jgi:hypothetical protein